MNEYGYKMHENRGGSRRPPIDESQHTEPELAGSNGVRNIHVLQGSGHQEGYMEKESSSKKTGEGSIHDSAIRRRPKIISPQSLSVANSHVTEGWGGYLYGLGSLVVGPAYIAAGATYEVASWGLGLGKNQESPSSINKASINEKSRTADLLRKFLSPESHSAINTAVSEVKEHKDFLNPDINPFILALRQVTIFLDVEPKSGDKLPKYLKADTVARLSLEKPKGTKKTVFTNIISDKTKGMRDLEATIGLATTPVKLVYSQSALTLHFIQLTALAKNSAHINKLDAETGMTPLHYAAAKGSLSLVAHLLSHGADPDIKSSKGENVYEQSVNLGNIYHGQMGRGSVVGEAFGKPALCPAYRYYLTQKMTLEYLQQHRKSH